MSARLPFAPVELLPAGWPEQLPCAWLQFDDQGVVRAVNQRFETGMDRPGIDMPGCALASLLSADSKLYFSTAVLPGLLAQGQMDDVSLVFATGHGEWPLAACLHREDNGGRWLTSAVLTPAGEKLLLQAELRRARQSLEIMPGAVLQGLRLTSGALQFPFAGPRLDDLLGVTPAQVASDPQLLFNAVLAEDRERFTVCLTEASQGGETEWRLMFRAECAPSRQLELVARFEPGGMLWQGVIADVSERQLLRRQLRLHTEFDPLTKLPNRDRLIKQLQHGIDGGASVAVLFMDVDRFKQVNDSLGHEAGDQLLQMVAQRLRHQLRSTDALLRTYAPDGATGPDLAGATMAARLGGDEFVVLVNGLDTDAATQSVAERLVQSLSRPYQVDGHEIVASVSVGVVRGHAQSTPAQLLRDADTAMYEAKRQGRGRWVQFRADMHERVASSMAVESDLREALRGDQLRVVFQPIVEIASGRVTGMEALARWKHPQRGEVSPVVFIPIAEDAGLIGLLGEQALRLACQSFMAWRADGVPLPPRLSVNLSRAQLQDRGLAQRVASVLAEVDMPCTALQLEVTESLAMQDEAVRKGLMELRELGIQLALDDFGTGHSSLAALNEFPVQQVKIDRSFVRQIETSAYHRALIQASLQVAQALSLEVVAEGVETEGQARLLSDLGCARAQGYLYARPLEAADMATYLRQAGAQALGRRGGDGTLGAAYSRAHQVLVTDEAGRTNYVNAAFTLHTGYTLQDLEGYAPGKFLQGADTDPRAVALLRDAVHTGSGCVGVEILNYRKDGTPYWVVIDIEPVRDASGTIVQFVSLQTEITSRRRERAELAELRERIDAVQATGLIGFWDRDMSSGVGRLDEVCRRLLGMHPGEPAPTREALERRLTPETRPALARYVAELKAGQRSGILEYSVTHAEGGVRDLQVLWTRQDQRLVGVMVDVSGSARVRDERARLASLLELAASAAHQVFWSHDLTTGMIDFLPRQQTLFAADAQGRSSADSVRLGALPEDREAVRNVRELATRQSGVIELEYRVRDVAGDVRHQLSRRIGLPSADGVVRQIVGVSMDVTAQHRREQAREVAAARQARILDAARVGGFRYDVAARCFEVDAQFNQIYGLAPDTRVLASADWYALIHPEDCERVRAASALLFGGPAVRPPDLRFRIVRADGSVRHIESCRAPEVDEQGRVVALFGAHRDTTAPD